MYLVLTLTAGPYLVFAPTEKKFYLETVSLAKSSSPDEYCHFLLPPSLILLYWPHSLFVAMIHGHHYMYYYNRKRVVYLIWPLQFPIYQSSGELIGHIYWKTQSKPVDLWKSFLLLAAVIVMEYYEMTPCFLGEGTSYGNF